MLHAFCLVSKRVYKTIGYVNSENEVIIPPQYIDTLVSGLHTFDKNQRAIVLEGEERFADSRFIMIDEENNFIKNSEYVLDRLEIKDRIYYIINQNIMSYKKGLIDKDGNIIIQPIYDFIGKIGRDRLPVISYKDNGEYFDYTKRPVLYFDITKNNNIEYYQKISPAKYEKIECDKCNSYNNYVITNECCWLKR